MHAHLQRLSQGANAPQLAPGVFALACLMAVCLHHSLVRAHFRASDALSVVLTHLQAGQAVCLLFSKRPCRCCCCLVCRNHLVLDLVPLWATQHLQGCRTAAVRVSCSCPDCSCLTQLPFTWQQCIFRVLCSCQSAGQARRAVHTSLPA